MTVLSKFAEALLTNMLVGGENDIRPPTEEPQDGAGDVLGVKEYGVTDHALAQSEDTRMGELTRALGFVDAARNMQKDMQEHLGPPARVFPGQSAASQHK